MKVRNFFLLIFRFWPFFTYFLTCTCDLLLLCRISFLYSFEMSHLFIFSLKVFYPTKNTAWKRYTPDYFFAFNIYCITRLKYNTFIQNTNWRIYKGIYILILPVGGNAIVDKFQNNYTFSIYKIVTHQKRMYILDDNVPGRFSDKMRKNVAS